MTTTPLITRLESLEVGSRKDSDDVLLALGWQNVDGWWFDPTISQEELEQLRTSDLEINWTLRPNITVNTDDAMGLIDPDEHAEFFMRDRKFDVNIRMRPGCSWYGKGRQANTLPLAICIALLRLKESG